MSISAEDGAELDVTAPARRRGTASARIHWPPWANQRPSTPETGSASSLVEKRVSAVLGGGVRSRFLGMPTEQVKQRG